MNINATIIGQSLTFFFFVWFCMIYIWPKIIKSIDNRKKNIYDSMVYIELAKKDLEVIRVDYTDNIKRAQIESKKILEKAKKYQSKIIYESKKEAKKINKKILEKAIYEIKMERKHIGEELHKKVSILVMKSAEKILERSLDESLNSDIINKIVVKL